MSRRKNKKFRIVESDEVQGEGSWVKLRAPSWGDFMDAYKADLTDQRLLAVGIRLLPFCVAEWNWVDDDGELLPSPYKQPEIINDLTPQEQMFLVDALDLSGMEERQKN